MISRQLSVIALVATFTAGGAAWGQCGFGGFWNDAAPLPAPRYQHTCTVVNGKIYVFGDYNHSPNNDSVFIYDPETNSWGSGTPMPPDPCGASRTPGRGMAAAAAVNGIIYLFGGNNNFSNCWLQSVVAYNPATDTWGSRTPMPTTDRGLMTATAVGNDIYVIGGADSYDQTHPYNLVEVYHTDTDSWTVLGPVMLMGRSHHAAVAIGAKIYLIGGVTGQPYQLVSQVDVFDTTTGVWTQAAPLPTPRMGLSAVLMNGKIYAVGGSADGMPLAVVEEYDPVLNCWRRVTSLPSARTRGCAAAAVDATGIHFIHFIGGNIGGGPKGALDDNLRGYPLPPSLADTTGPDGVPDGCVDAYDLAAVLGAWCSVAGGNPCGTCFP